MWDFSVVLVVQLLMKNLNYIENVLFKKYDFTSVMGHMVYFYSFLFLVKLCLKLICKQKWKYYHVMLLFIHVV